MADMPEPATTTPGDLAAERARVALEWDLPQQSRETAGSDWSAFRDDHYPDAIYEPRRQESDLCCTLYDVQCICPPDCRCRCKGCCR